MTIDYKECLLTKYKVMEKSPLDYEFDRNATYVIVGGLGGIGRNIAMWMYRHGARHLILLSRTDPKSDVAKELVATLEEGSVSLYTPKCDVSDPDAVEAVVIHAKANMPPIKGCIQASMVVEVGYIHSSRVLSGVSLANTEPHSRTESLKTIHYQHSNRQSILK